ncbi:MAG: 5-formyltetrahydrofolate cyclo-ligase [Clostridiales bacterium]|nr:5-formyltetrahydrofolate cyclo-ligase [Clostridiales bacterium]
MTKINRPKALIRKVFRDRAKGKDLRDVSVPPFSSWPEEWQDRVRRARRIAAYMPLPDELSLRNLRMNQKQYEDAGKLCFPKVEGENLRFFLADEKEQFRTGAFHIEEPDESCVEVMPEEIDIVLIPAVAYGKDGIRIGRGKGFYDRFISQIFGSCGKIEGKYLIGVIPQDRILGEVPSDSWDLRVDALLTEESLIDLTRSRETEEEKK